MNLIAKAFGVVGIVGLSIWNLVSNWSTDMDHFKSEGFSDSASAIGTIVKNVIFGVLAVVALVAGGWVPALIVGAVALFDSATGNHISTLIGTIWASVIDFLSGITGKIIGFFSSGLAEKLGFGGGDASGDASGAKAMKTSHLPLSIKGRDYAIATGAVPQIIASKMQPVIQSVPQIIASKVQPVTQSVPQIIASKVQPVTQSVSPYERNSNKTSEVHNEADSLMEEMVRTQKRLLSLQTQMNGIMTRVAQNTVPRSEPKSGNFF
jgi:hypothetical protein